MKIKHKLIKEFQYVSPDKKIFTLKEGTILNEYVYKVKDEEITIDRDIIDNNPDFFELIDWKTELHMYIKSNKLPQPKSLAKKIIPFIDEMILSSMNQNNQNKIEIDEDKLEEIKEKENGLKRREKNISNKEEEADIRLKRIEKRENEYKNDLLNLDSKEDELRLRTNELTDKEIMLTEKEQEINEKDRNIDKKILESANDIDGKFKEMKKKIDLDIDKVNKREKELDNKEKELKKLSDSISEKNKLAETNFKKSENKLEEFNDWAAEIKKLDREIKDWEKLHWKLKRMKKPPSVL